MTFTDDNLERLKAELEGNIACNWTYLEIEVEIVTALFGRLEAAETICAVHPDGILKDQWRKSKGQK